MAGTGVAEAALSPPEKVAAALLTIGESSAAIVLRQMDEKSIAAISDAMARMRNIDIKVATRVMDDLVTDLEANGIATPGGVGHLRRLLASAFGDQRAGEIIERMMRSRDGAIDVLSEIDPKTLAEQVRQERPQLLAVLLGHMNKLSATGFLATLPEETVIEVVYRYARMDTIQPAAMSEMRTMLAEMLGGHVESKTTMIGGVRNAADLLNGMGPAASERALTRIRETDPELADRIRENMFTFEDLMRLSDQTLQVILRAIDPDRLAPALRSASPEIRERIYANVSRKAAQFLRDEVENGPPVTRSDAQAAQRVILEAAMALAQEGKLSLRGEEDMV
jgi:flagellar motor switch protein FliG